MQTRTFSFSNSALTRAKADGSGGLTVDMAFASDTPYERWFGIEILDMAPTSIRLARLNDGDGGPVLYNHDWNDLRGRHVPGSVKVDADNVLRGQVIVPDATQLTRDTQALIESKTLSKASVGYQIHKVIEQTTAKQADGSATVRQREIDGATFERLIKSHSMERDGRSAGGDAAAFRRSLDAACGAFDRAADEEPVYRVVDWEPLENSFVTVPADNAMGVGRSHEQPSAEAAPAAPAAAASAPPAPAGARNAGNPVSHPAAPAAPTERKPQMAEAQASAGIAESYASVNAVELEKVRRKAIEDTVKAHRLDARLGAKWIEEGTPLHEVASQVLDVMEERGKSKGNTAAALGLSVKETQRYSVFKAVRALHYGAKKPEFIRDAAFEIECSNAVGKQLGKDTANLLIPAEVLSRPIDPQVMQRAMATSPGSKGGYAVDVQNMGFIDILRNRSVSMNMGARVISGLVGNVMFPRQTGKATVTWQAGDGTSVSATDQTLGQLSMTPKTAVAITDVSEQLLRQSSPSAEAFIMADLARDLAIDGVDNAVINGTGGAQPLGIKNTTGVTTSQDAATATYAKILAFPSTAAGVNAIRGNPGFVTNAAGAAVLMQRARFANTDTPLWEGNMMDGVCVGFRGMSSEQLASGNLIFGSWDEVVIGEWGVLELATDNGGTRFNQVQVGIRAMWMVDVLLRYPQAFVVSVNLS